MDERALLESTPTRLLIGGSWTKAQGNAEFEVLDPATDEVLTRVADAAPDDGDAALAAAHEAQPDWERTPARERAELLRRIFDAVIERTDELALLITLEMGKSLAESKGEVAYGAEFLRWYAEEAVRAYGSYLPAPTGNGHILTTRRPVGPCLLITPWNFPLAMATRKIGPALAAGCTAVIKPAAVAPLTTLRLAEIARACGLPDGVLNVIPTTSPGEVMGPLLTDERTRKLSFTGSTEVGRSLMAQAAERVLRVSMELGGNAPFLVFEDADLDAAVDGAMAAKMRNIGESCVAANRFLVHRSVAEPFTEALAERMGGLSMGRGTEEGVDVGPLIDRDAVDKVDDLVSAAAASGAEIRVGGERPDRPGCFYPPTVLANVPSDAELLREEIFGPVAPVTTFADDEEAVALANDTPHGLVAYAYTRDVGRALRLADVVEAGMLGVNRGIVSEPAAPFGGIKQSGLGKEGGAAGLDEYLTTRYIALEA